MGRGKVEMRHIEDKSTRQVTFSKRKGGLFKKARELSVLCDVEVALIVFSAGGKLYEFSGGESLEKVIQRYQAHKDADAAVNEHTSGTEKLLPAWRTPDAGSDLLLSVQRHVEAKTVVQLDLTQVTQLVRNLESLLREAQVRKTELMIQSVTGFQQQEIPLPPENLLMENELSSIANQQNQSQNQQHEQDLDDIPNPNQQQQQFLLMGMHLNNSNNGGVGDSSVIPIHQLQHHQQNQPFLMGMNLNHNNFPTTDDNNNISNGGAGSGPSAAASLLQRDAFQKDILHFF